MKIQASIVSELAMGGIMLLNKEVIKTDKAPLPVAHYSQAIKCGNLVFLQGLIAIDPSTNKIVSGGIREHTLQVFKNISAILEGAGLDRSHILRVTVFLTNLKDYNEFNRTYNTFFDNKVPPVRTTVQAKVPLGSRLEIEATAYCPDHDSVGDDASIETG